jgi:CdiI N-terminal domain
VSFGRLIVALKEEHLFDIAFLTDTPERQDQDGAGRDGLRGRTTLGDYTEEFLAPLDHWSRSDYERQWFEAANRVLGEAARAAFFTAAFRFWWTMWRESEVILVHEELLTPERLAHVTDYGVVPYHLIEDRRTHSEDGAPISEWQITVADVRGFLKRRCRTSG